MSVLEAGELARGAVTTLAMMAVHGTVLALLALAIVRAGTLRPAWQAAIWFIVVLKFVLPWGPAMPWSIADLFASLGGGAAGGALIVHAPAVVTVTSPSIVPALGWLALALAWAVIAGALLTRAVWRHQLVHRAARAGAEPPLHATSALRSLARTMRVRAPRLVIGAPAVTPHVVGVLRPIVVVPPSLLDQPALLSAALAHELAHVRRRDALGRWIQLVATSMFFWWPVVRFVARRLDLAREAACDAWALTTVDVAPSAYARLLVRMAAMRTVDAHALASPRSLDARIAAVLGPIAQPRLGWWHGALLVAWAAVALGGARTSHGATGEVPCDYTPAMAEALRQAHPEADLDGDGYLSRDEACRLQADAQRAVATPDPVAPMRLELVASAGGRVMPLCCNCTAGDRKLPASGIPARSLGETCQRSEGVDR